MFMSSTNGCIKLSGIGEDSISSTPHLSILTQSIRRTQAGHTYDTSIGCLSDFFSVTQEGLFTTVGVHSDDIRAVAGADGTRIIPSAALQMLWALILTSDLLFLPKSPRLFVKRGKIDRAADVSGRLGDQARDSIRTHTRRNTWIFHQCGCIK